MLTAGLALVMLAAGCKAPSPAPAPVPGAAPVATAAAPPMPGGRPVTLPDLSRVEASVRSQAQERYDALMELLKRPNAPAADKGVAYGNLAMLLHAGEYYEAAEPAYPAISR